MQRPHAETSVVTQGALQFWPCHTRCKVQHNHMHAKSVSQTTHTYMFKLQCELPYMRFAMLPIMHLLVSLLNTDAQKLSCQVTMPRNSHRWEMYPTTSACTQQNRLQSAAHQYWHHHHKQSTLKGNTSVLPPPIVCTKCAEWTE